MHITAKRCTGSLGPLLEEKGGIVTDEVDNDVMYPRTVSALAVTRHNYDNLQHRHVDAVVDDDGVVAVGRVAGCGVGADESGGPARVQPSVGHPHHPHGSPPHQGQAWQGIPPPPRVPDDTRTHLAHSSHWPVYEGRVRMQL